MRSVSRVVAAAALLGAIAPRPAASQTLDRPPRMFRGLFGGAPPDPDRARTELTLQTNALFGYDENAAQELGLVSPQDPRLAQSASSALGEARLRYWHGRTAQNISVEGRGYVNGYSDLGLGAQAGGGVHVSAATRLGRRVSLVAGQSVSSDPSFYLNNQLGPPAGDSPTPNFGNPTYGFTERRVLAADSTVALERQFGRRSNMNVGYNYSTRRYSDFDLGGGNSDVHTANAGYSKQLGRSMAMRGEYVFNRTTVIDFAGVSRDIQNQSISGGPSYSRQVGRERHVSASFNLGAIYVDTVGQLSDERFRYWAPYYGGSASIDLGRSWALRGNASRNVTVLDGATRQEFLSNNVSALLSGYVGPRVDLSLSGAYNGGESNAELGVTGRFSLYQITAQARVAVSQLLALVAVYDRYSYSFDGNVDLPEGYPPGYTRNAIRIGVTLWLPLVGSYAPETPGGAGRTTGR
jgi:hypothetical protein